MTPLMTRVAFPILCLAALASAEPPAPAPAPPPAVTARAVAVNPENVLKDISDGLRSDEAKRQKLVEELTAFFRSKVAGDKQFHAPALDAKALEVPEQGIKPWLEDNVKDQARHAELAALVYVMKDPKAREQLVTKMLLFSTEDKAKAEEANPRQTGQPCLEYVGANPGGAQARPVMTAFLNCMRINAGRIYDAPKISDQELKANIDRLKGYLGVIKNEPVRPGQPGDDPARRPGAGKGEPDVRTVGGFNEMYMGGAEIVHLAHPGKPNETYRTLAVKITETKQGRRIGIWDITEAGLPRGASKIYGEELPIEAAEKSGFAGNKDLRVELKRGENGDLEVKVGFASPDGKGFYTPPAGSPYSGPLATSLTRLDQKLVEHIEKNGYIDRVGDQDFRIVSFGGKEGKYAYYPCDPVTKRLLNGSKPQMLAIVSKYNPDTKETDAVPGDIPLGFARTGGENKHWVLQLKDGVMTPVQKEAAPATPAPGAPKASESSAPAPAAGSGAAPAKPSEQGARTPAPAAATTAAAGVSEEPTDCKPAGFQNVRARSIESDGKTWKYWTGHSRGRNILITCFFGTAYLQAGGYMADIKIVGNELQVTTVDLDPSTVELDRVNVADIKRGKVATKEKPNEPLSVEKFVIYHAFLADVRKQADEGKSEQLSEESWLIEHRNKIDPAKKSMLQIYTDRDGMARVDAAMALVKTPTDSSLFGGDERVAASKNEAEKNKQKLKKFADISIKKQGAEPPDADQEKSRPFLTVNLHLDDPKKEANVLIFTDWKKQQTALKWLVPLVGFGSLEEPKEK